MGENISVHFTFRLKMFLIWDFPGGPVAKTTYSQCRGPGFNPWSEIRSCMPQLRLGAAK